MPWQENRSREIGKVSKGAHGDDPSRERRVEAVRRLWRECGPHAVHCDQVSRLAIEIFGQIHFPPLEGVCGPGRPCAEELLEYGGLLHDIGYTIGADQHNKHSWRIIRRAVLPGVSSSEREIVALVARFHRGKLPRRKMKSVADLREAEYELVRRLAGVLRVADGLDRSQRSLVRSVQVVPTASSVDMAFTASGQADLEVWAAQKKADLLEEVLERPVTIRIA